MIEINVGIGQQNGTDCYEVKSVNINPYKIKSEFANTIIDGKAFNNLADLKNHIQQIVNNILANTTLVFQMKTFK